MKQRIRDTGAVIRGVVIDGRRRYPEETNPAHSPVGKRGIQRNPIRSPIYTIRAELPSFGRDVAAVLHVDRAAQVLVDGPRRCGADAWTIRAGSAAVERH